MIWFLDFEAYHIEGDGEFKYVVKEVSILNRNGERCYTYFVKNPSILPNMPNTETANFQFQRHGLRWKFGDYSFCEAIKDIDRKVGSDIVNVKGLQKSNFIKEYLLNVVEVEGLPPFKDLNNCMSERCEVKHGNQCARRKVHELRHAYMKSKQLGHLI